MKPTVVEKKYNVGLVTGKFLPFHRGHQHVVETAVAQCEQVYVHVVAKRGDPITRSRRARWIESLYPMVVVQSVEDIMDDDNSVAWAHESLAWMIPGVIDAVFTSEDYGDLWAAAISEISGHKCDHVLVDRHRETFPTSGTEIRQDVLKHWDMLSPVVRADYAVRVVCIGAESSGTTTLSRALALHYRAPWVRELGRDYSEAFIFAGGLAGIEWNANDFAVIARMQQEYENAMAGQSPNGLIICDTNATATAYWEYRYTGTMTAPTLAVADRDQVDLYILTDIDGVPFEDDGFRDGDGEPRETMHQRFLHHLEEDKEVRERPFIIASGDREKRLHDAITAIDEIRAAKEVVLVYE